MADKLEGRVARLEATVEREAALRATMDEDQSKMSETLRANGRLLQALHDTQQDHTGRLTRIEGRLGNVEGRLGNVEGRLGNVEGRLGNVEADLAVVKVRLGTVDVRLGTVEEKLDTVHIGVHAILDLLDTHLARKRRLPGLAWLLSRPRQQGGPASGS